MDLRAAFTAGNLAVFSADSASANNTTFTILELSPSTANQASPVNSIPINGTSGPSALRTSGSATSPGYLADSNDGRLLAFTAHNGTSTSANANTIIARGVGTLDASGTFSLATTYTGISGNQTRGATIVDNSTWFIGDQGGIYSNGSAIPSPAGNFRGVKSFGGTVYVLTASGSLPPVGTISAATGGSYTALPGLANGASSRQDFYLVSSAGNNAYDILYVLDATSATAGTIFKYSLVSGSWTANGSYATTFGGFGLCAARSGSGARLYVTTGTGNTAANQVIQLTDTAGYSATVSITTANNVTLYTAIGPATMKGIAFAPTCAAGGNVSISEFMAKNTLGITDEDGARSDWIEIHNGGCSSVDLNGWSLTDDATLLTKWRFPATNIAAGQFMIVWASDKNRRTPGGPLHTNFKLAEEGDYLALVQPDGVTIATQFYPTFPPQLPDVSYGLPADWVTNHYLAWPTPGVPNSPGTNYIVEDLAFTPGRGWYTDSVAVSLGTPTAGVTIYYTTDGSEPGPTNGSVYAGPLVFTNTTVLRGAAYRPAYLPSFASHTYVFPKQVIYQTGTGFPTSWGTNSAGAPVQAIYNCNSNIVNEPRWSNQIPASLLSLPTVSIAMNPDDMFGTNGIYSNPMSDGVEWERPCSAEYFRPDLQPGFQINCGIRIQGGLSREESLKHSFRLLFKQIYGAGKLLFDLYPGSPVRDFDALLLRASFNDQWYGMRPDPARAQMQRDQWCADTQQETGGYGTHGTYVQLYINGLYWGLYNLGERPDASYAAEYLGGQKSDYDAYNFQDLKDGTTNAWTELAAIATAGITNATTWSNMCHYLDVPSFIDYLLINFYAGNGDWPWNNYWKVGAVTHGVPFHFLSFDAEETFLFVTDDMTGITQGDPGLLYSSLRQYPEFRRLFGDHVQQLLFNGGALTPERCAPRWMKRAREIDSGIVAESARWGVTNFPWNGGYLITHDHWIAEQAYLLANWFPLRTDILIAQLRTAGMYPALEAPVFTPHGGIICESLAVTITIPPGTIAYYTINGSDPRLPDGAISPEARVYAQGPAFTLTLNNNTHLCVRTFATNAWSALVQADYLLANQVVMRVSQVSPQSDGSVMLDFLAWPGVSYTLLAATNLNSDPKAPRSCLVSRSPGWEAIARLAPFPDGTFSFVDTAAANHPLRYYRLAWP
jgi:hypothetical protein